jgi:hypothetical protein
MYRKVVGKAGAMQIDVEGDRVLSIEYLPPPRLEPEQLNLLSPPASAEPPAGKFS